MKPRHLLLINAIFLGMMFLSASTVYQFLTGHHPLDRLFSAADKQAKAVTTNTCTSRAPIEALASAEDVQLRRLASYQEACHSFVSDTLMTFVGMPTSHEGALEAAKHIAAKLKRFGAVGVRPLVIAEPTDSDGNNLDFADIASGAYDQWFDDYFGQLKAMGLTDEQMGIWNPLPEANLPYWKNNKPEYFAPAVNRYLAMAFKHFPKLKTSILLNSATYETTDFNWESGEYQSLLPFVKGITPGTITYVGLQGFPWVAPRGGLGSILNAAEFLDPALITEVADKLKVKDIWLNTGTFSVKYALDPARTKTIPPEQRKNVLSTIQTQTGILRDMGYAVTVSLFAKDKSKESEETNWSYWDDQPFESSYTPVLTEFVNDLSAQGTGFWLFDDEL